MSNLISGAILLLLTLPWSGLGLFLIGAVYFVCAGLFLGIVYARPELTIRQEALAWFAPWVIAVALRMGIAVSMEFTNTVSHYLFGLYVALIVATPCYLVWQLVASAVRQLMEWKSGGATSLGS